ncbi:hypothetical protein BDN67DRAFT_261607 [Paxillus ammoniavirescens]|nr:hypothetical protein BDN67DRAFT_261607 [Paxillus ammoniavirescens]
MSATTQDQADSTAQVPVQGSQPYTGKLESTPLVKKAGPYSSELPPGQKAIDLRLAEEMDGRFVGPMPVEVFLEKYLTSTIKIEDLPVVPRDAFGRVAAVEDATQMYGQFIQAISPWLIGLKAVDTSASAATGDFGLKPGVSLFDKDYVPIKNRADFSNMELFIELKKSGDDVLFADPRNEAARQAAIENGSFQSQSAKAKEIRAHHGHQFRHFSFSVFVFGTQVRFMRWDASAVVVTEQFDYVENPEVMANFFWKFSHLPPALRGRDMSVVPELEADVEERVRRNLSVKPETPLFRYTVPGLNGYCYGPRLPHPSRSIIGRTTRTLPVWFIPPLPTVEQQHIKQETPLKQEEASTCDPGWAIERAAYLKDCWRFISSSHPVQSEHEIYEMLHSEGTPNIPQVCGGDVGGPSSEINTHGLAGPFVHYRLLLDVVARPLTSFQCTKELVRGIHGAMKAHWFAYTAVRLLHRDISPGNIILTKDGEGLLIDWDLAKTVDDNVARRRERMGTSQFISPMLLENPGMTHTLQDDIESFLHVLLWACMTSIPATNGYSAKQRGNDLRRILDVIDFAEDDAAIGGTTKADVFGGGFTVLDLSSLFKSPYMEEPPTEEERERVGCKRDLLRLIFKVSQYDEDMPHETTEWFMEALDKILQMKARPSDDKAQKGLDTPAIGVYTEAQMSRKSDQPFTSRGEDSKSMASAGSLKRERSISPTPEGPTKRRRGAILGSNTPN